jgi:hypothetical protein
MMPARQEILIKGTLALFSYNSESHNYILA